MRGEVEYSLGKLLERPARVLTKETVNLRWPEQRKVGFYELQVIDR